MMDAGEEHASANPRSLGRSSVNAIVLNRRCQFQYGNTGLESSRISVSGPKVAITRSTKLNKKLIPRTFSRATVGVPGSDIIPQKKFAHQR